MLEFSCITPFNGKVFLISQCGKERGVDYREKMAAGRNQWGCGWWWNGGWGYGGGVIAPGAQSGVNFSKPGIRVTSRLRVGAPPRVLIDLLFLFCNLYRRIFVLQYLPAMFNLGYKWREYDSNRNEYRVIFCNKLSQSYKYLTLGGNKWRTATELDNPIKQNHWWNGALQLAWQRDASENSIWLYAHSNVANVQCHVVNSIYIY